VGKGIGGPDRGSCSKLKLGSARQCMKLYWCMCVVKGKVSRDFRPMVFSMSGAHLAP
jgi:hypothetical protein